MNTSQTLGQNMSQQQRLSPQLQQSLAILQAQVGELRQMIGQEMAQNPVLEAEERDTSLDEEQPEAELADEDFAAEFDKLSQMDEEWRTYLQQSAATNGSRTSEEEERRQFLFDSLAAPVWTNIAGQAFTGDGTAHPFTDSAATGAQRFYRINVNP